ncbi:Nucleoside triphosphate pyrophosphohydrolase MazG [hydrothermal vent metagenome]|uniref:Nucleoside triphosphate pyrophosphohydrolase MazG n=1 Tax=hydrothermal vent metagenome TaxID=652676 RepID=A0A3B1D6F3_9ZZZZ
MSEPFDRLVAVMTRLRGNSGCSWDREQTHESLKPHLIEEAYEVLEAIESTDATSLCEELGDLLFQVLFHAQIAKDEGHFDIEAILETITEKMIRRHPHVFSEAVTERKVEAGLSQNSEDPSLRSETVLMRWEEIKAQEPGKKDRVSALQGVPKSLPALLRAHQVQARAARVGFDWKESTPIVAKIEEELGELKEAVDMNVRERVESELGDLLFSVVNYGRFLKINSEDALRGTITRFTRRFEEMEAAVKKTGQRLDALSLHEMDLLWEKAKSNEKA